MLFTAGLSNNNLVSSPPAKRLLPENLQNCEQEIIESLAARGLQLLKPIGDGVQGCAYLLTDIKTGEISSVLKITPPSTENNLFGVKKFGPDYGAKKFDPDRGSHLIANIKHSGICSPTQFFYYTPGNQSLSASPSSESICIATIMPYVKGERFGDKQRAISQNAEWTLRFGLALINAVYELSVHQLQHNDLHEENIMVDSNLRPVLIDFDMCRRESKGLHQIDDRDFLKMSRHLEKLIRRSPDIKPRAKKFLIKCFTRLYVELYDSKATSAPFPLSMTFMQACIDHLSEIKANSAQRLLNQLCLIRIDMQKMLKLRSRL